MTRTVGMSARSDVCLAMDIVMFFLASGLFFGAVEHVTTATDSINFLSITYIMSLAILLPVRLLLCFIGIRRRSAVPSPFPDDRKSRDGSS
jgi:hypothetical protein